MDNEYMEIYEVNGLDYNQPDDRVQVYSSFHRNIEGAKAAFFDYLKQVGCGADDVIMEHKDEGIMLWRGGDDSIIFTVNPIEVK